MSQNIDKENFEKFYTSKNEIGSSHTKIITLPLMFGPGKQYFAK